MKKSTSDKVADGTKFAWFLALLWPLYWLGKKLGRLPPFPRP